MNCRTLAEPHVGDSSSGQGTDENTASDNMPYLFVLYNCRNGGSCRSNSTRPSIWTGDRQVAIRIARAEHAVSESAGIIPTSQWQKTRPAVGPACQAGSRAQGVAPNVATTFSALRRTIDTTIQLSQQRDVTYSSNAVWLHGTSFSRSGPTRQAGPTGGVGYRTNKASLRKPPQARL